MADPVVQKFKTVGSRAKGAVQRASDIVGGAESAAVSGAKKGVQGLSDAAGSIESGIGHFLFGGIDPSSGSSASADPKSSKGLTPSEKKYLEPGTKLDKPAAQYPNTQQAIDQLMQTYMGELNSLGPEYGAEMEYLKPYLMPTNETFQQVTSNAAAQASPTGNTALNAADVALGKQLQSEPGPGFGGEYAAGQQYEQSLPYGQLLQTLLQAGKNEILGYSTIPNLSSINTKGWPQDISQAYQYAVRGIGYNPATGLATPQNAATQAQQQQAANPGTPPSVTGGGNA